MKAILHSEYGGPHVLRLEEVEKPTPKDAEVLIKVHAAALNPVDWHLIRGVPYPLRITTGGLRRPRRARRVGSDYSGVVEAVGPGVTELSVGDAVLGMSFGSLAEYLTVRSDSVVVRKPEGVTHEEAAGVPLAGLTALQAVRDKTAVRPGHRILINGAAGGIGSLAVQIAKALGAEVTGVQSSAALELVRSLGADHVIDYTKEDFTLRNERYDVIIDNVSSRPVADLLRVLKPGGVLVPNGGGSPEKGVSVVSLIRTLLLRPFMRQKVVFFMTKPKREDLQTLVEWIASGKVRPVVDKAYPLRAAADALRHLETGHAHGKVIVTMTTAS